MHLYTGRLFDSCILICMLGMVWCGGRCGWFGGVVVGVCAYCLVCICDGMLVYVCIVCIYCWFCAVMVDLLYAGVGCLVVGWMVYSDDSPGRGVGSVVAGWLDC